MTKSTPPDKIVIDQFFAIPRGAEESFTYNPEVKTLESVESTSNQVYSEDDDSALNDPALNEMTLDRYLENQGLQTPEGITVVEQRLRRAPGGQQVVDVTIESEDVGGAINYEFRVVKV